MGAHRVIPIDHGWAWMVCFAAFGCMLISGVAFSLGVYVAELIIEQHLDRASVALFGSLQLTFLYLAGPTTYLSEKTSHRFVVFVFSVIATVSIISSIYITSMEVLYVTFGVIPGFCTGTLITQSMIIMNRYFKVHAGAANCIALVGCALGTVVFPPLFRYTIDTFGWRGSLYILAAIFIHGCIFAMCMRPVPLMINNSIDDSASIENVKTKHRLSSTKIYKNPKFYIFLLSSFFLTFSWPIVFVFAPTLFHENQMQGWQIDVLMMIIGFSNTFVRIFSAFAMDSMVRRWNITIIHTIPIYVLSISILLFVVYPCMTIFVIASVLFGMSYGALTCTQSITSRDIGGIYYNIVYSWAYCASVLGTVLGPYLSSYIYTATQSETVAFGTFSSIAFISASTNLISLYYDRKSRADRNRTEVPSTSRDIEIFITHNDDDTKNSQKFCDDSFITQPI